MGKNPVRQCRPRQLSDVVENSRLVQSRISVPDGARPFGEVTPHSKTTGTPSVLPTFGHQMWGVRGRSRRASFASDRMGIQEEQHSRAIYRVQRKWKRYIVMLEHFPASDLQNGSSAWGSRGHARRVHAHVVGPGSEITEGDRGGCSGGGRADVEK